MRPKRGTSGGPGDDAAAESAHESRKTNPGGSGHRSIVFPAEEIVEALDLSRVGGHAKRLSALAVDTGVSHPEAMCPSELMELSRSQCLHLLATASVGRVGLHINDLPAVLPVNFAVLDGDVVFRTMDGTKFRAAETGRVLAFEADGYSANGLDGWSVLVQGVSRVVTEASELYRAQRLTKEPWAVDGAADRIVRISSTLVSGRLFQRAAK